MSAATTPPTKGKSGERLNTNANAPRIRMEKLKIKIAEDFSKITGPRLIDEGEYSGEAFYNEVLLPKYQEIYRRYVFLCNLL